LKQRTEAPEGRARRSQSNQRKFKAADNFGASVFQFAHAIQLAPPCGAQTVLLAASPYSKLQNSRFIPKLSKAVLNPINNPNRRKAIKATKSFLEED